LAPKKKTRYTRSNPDPDPPAVFENPNLIPNILRKQEEKEDFTDSSLEAIPQSYIPTPAKISFHPHTTAPTSPSSSSTSQSTFSTPPSTAHTPIIPTVPVVPFVPALPFIPINMANRYAPLQLPTNPGAMPLDYQTKITYFDGTSSYTTLQHTKKMQDYFENYEIDDDGVRMNFFFQSLTGDVRPWFRALPTNSIGDPEALYQTFLNRCEKKKDPLHILSEYDTIKRGPQEVVLDYSARFNNLYNAIPQNLRPPPDLALYKFPDGFDSDMAYQLREIARQTLADMQNVAISVEANLIAKRNRARAERRTTFKEEPSALDQKLDAIISGMHRLGDRVETVERKSSWDGKQSNTIKNQNFRKNQNPNVGRASPDQDIRPPFQENYTEASTFSEPTEDTHINLMGLNGEQQVFLTKEDQDDNDINQFQTKSGESFDFREGYDTTVYEVHKQYKLRSRTVDVPEPVKTKDTKQPKRIKEKDTLTGSSDKIGPNPIEVIVKDVTEIYPSKNQPLVSSSLKENSNSTPQNTSKTEILQDNTENQEKVTENVVEKGRSASHNTKTQSEKPFDLEA